MGPLPCPVPLLRSPLSASPQQALTDSLIVFIMFIVSPTFRSEQLISFFLLANGEEILQKGYWLSHLLQIS